MRSANVAIQPFEKELPKGVDALLAGSIMRLPLEERPQAGTTGKYEKCDGIGVDRTATSGILGGLPGQSAVARSLTIESDNLCGSSR